MHACKTPPRQEHTNTFKVTKDIPAGQEIFVKYGTAAWFENKNLPYFDVDYARTMWRPDLHPLPCRESVRHTPPGVDGRHSFAAMADTIPSGTVVDISLCLEVSLFVVDQFPFLWDFVLVAAASQTVCVCAYARMQKCVGNQYTHTNKCLRVKSRRHVFLCHTPRKFLPHPLLTSLTCTCHFMTWAKMYVSVRV